MTFLWWSSRLRFAQLAPLWLLLQAAACADDSTVGGGGSGLGGDTGNGGDTGDGGMTSDGGMTGSGGDGSTCWLDPTTGSTWEYQPQTPPPLLDWQAAIDYCASKSACGQDDWRLPNIDELRGLLRGCAGTITGGSCAVHDGSGSSDFMGDCYCSNFDGPGPGGCYWPDEFGDNCGFGGWNYWSSSAVVDNPPTAWSIAFHVGRVSITFKTEAFRARCLR